MKKLLKVGTVITLLICLTGCNGAITRDIRHQGYTVSDNEFVCNKWQQDKVIYTNGTYAITEDGNLYDVSLSQPYTNEENCKEISFTTKIIAYMDSNILKGEDNKFYYAPGTTTSTPLTEVTANDSNYQLYTLLLGEKEVKKVITIDANNGIYDVLKEDGTVTQYTIKRQDYNLPYIVTDQKEVYSSEDYGKIIDFNYKEESKETYLKTNNAIYRMELTNEERCSEYADVECEYYLRKNETLTEYYNDNSILYYGSNLVITTYGKIFTLS